MTLPIYDPPRIIIALDQMTAKQMVAIIRELGTSVWGYQISADFLDKEGIRGVKRIIKGAGCSLNLVVDRQLTGMPQTVRRQAAVYADPNIRFITCNAASGIEGIKAAVGAGQFPHVLVSSILSSFGVADVNLLFGTPYKGIKAHQFALMAKECKAFGILCSASELEFLILHTNDPDMKKIVKAVVGVRPDWYPNQGEHKEVITPRRAWELGANYIIVGGPVTTASNRLEAVKRIQAEFE